MPFSSAFLAGTYSDEPHHFQLQLLLLLLLLPSQTFCWLPWQLLLQLLQACHDYFLPAAALQ